MPEKTVPTSVRLPDRDAEFIAGLEINGARTPSEKLRAIVAEARERHEKPGDYTASRNRVERDLSPEMSAIRGAELALSSHSELLAIMHEWLPEVMAYLISSVPGGKALAKKDALIQFEQGVVERIFRLFEAALRLGVTEKSPCYDQHVIDQQLDRLTDLMELIIERKQTLKGD